MSTDPKTNHTHTHTHTHIHSQVTGKYLSQMDYRESLGWGKHRNKTLKQQIITFVLPITHDIMFFPDRVALWWKATSQLGVVQTTAATISRLIYELIDCQLFYQLF